MYPKPCVYAVSSAVSSWNLYKKKSKAKGKDDKKTSDMESAEAWAPTCCHPLVEHWVYFSTRQMPRSLWQCWAVGGGAQPCSCTTTAFPQHAASRPEGAILKAVSLCCWVRSQIMLCPSTAREVCTDRRNPHIAKFCCIIKQGKKGRSSWGELADCWWPRQAIW